MPFDFKDSQDVAEKKFKRALRIAFIGVAIMAGSVGFVIANIIHLVI